MKKSILAITGIRSEYDLIAPVLATLRDDALCDVRLVVSGTHLSDWHGDSGGAIERDGFMVVDKIDSLFMDNPPTQRAKGVGVLLQGLAQTVERERPDMLFVVGDREESIATAIVGTYMDVLVVHMGGGDTVFGNADDPMRFATSKLAHVHLTFSQRSAENLTQVGEETFRIFNVGNPALDRIRMVPERTLQQVSEALAFDIRDGNYIVLLQHPLSSERDAAGPQMATTLKALEQFCAATTYKVLAIAPNTDPGARAIVEVLASYEGEPFIRFFKNLDREWFVNVMRHARAFVGNSSAGILEAPYYKLPVVNVGNRQRGREQAGNVEFVPHEVGAIDAALRRATMDSAYRTKVAGLENPFGDGRTSERVRDVLVGIDPHDPKWLVKRNFAGATAVEQRGELQFRAVI